MGYNPDYIRPNARQKYCGVYRIRHLATGACYIGSSIDITNRYTHHRYCLRRGIHKSKNLQHLWSEDGEDCFSFEVVEICTPEELLSREDFYIARTRVCLNTCTSSNTGLFNTGENQNKKAAAIARWQKPEYKKKRAKQMANRDSSGKLLPNT